MSTQQLLNIVKERGLKIVMDGDKPILKRPDGNEAVTDKLLACLKRHREQIISILKNQ